MNKKIITGFVILLIIQVFSLLFMDKTTTQELEYASSELQHVKVGIDVTIEEKAKMLYLAEMENKIISARIRDLDNSSKKDLIPILTSKIQELQMVNPSEAIKLSHQLEVMKNGHNTISFIMEKILRLNSLNCLIYQKSYLFIIITSLLLFVYLIFAFRKKKKN